MRFNFTIAILILLVASCKEPESFFVGSTTTIDLPNYIPQNDELKNIPLSGIELGKLLFNDRNLSSNHEVACASCHLEKFAFSDGIALTDVGVSGESLERNSPALFNLAWHKQFFWDGGAADLESQAIAPFLSEHEMNLSISDLIDYVSSQKKYVSLYEETFQDKQINTSNTLKAFKWFQLTLISFNTKYDDYYAEQNESLLSESELKGMHVFKTNCNSCHTLPLGSSYLYENNKLDSSFNYPFEDPRLGRYRITNDINDLGKYKIPSVRNLSYTAPYMHDGRFSTLDEIINHYNSKTFGDTLSISLSQTEITELKTFLLTLNDKDFVGQ